VPSAFDSGAPKKSKRKSLLADLYKTKTGDAIEYPKLPQIHQMDEYLKKHNVGPGPTAAGAPRLDDDTILDLLVRSKDDRDTLLHNCHSFRAANEITSNLLDKARARVRELEKAQDAIPSTLARNLRIAEEKRDKAKDVAKQLQQRAAGYKTDLDQAKAAIEQYQEEQEEDQQNLNSLRAEIESLKRRVNELQARPSIEEENDSLDELLDEEPGNHKGVLFSAEPHDILRARRVKKTVAITKKQPALRTFPQLSDEEDEDEDSEQDQRVRESSHSTIDKNQTKTIITDRSISDPPFFDGNKEDFMPWVDKLMQKLSVTTFKTEEVGIRWLLTKLTNSAYRTAAPRVPGPFKKVSNAFTTVDQMIEQLNEQYGEHDAENKHYTAMSQLMQGPSESFTSFYTKYQAHAPYIGMTPGKQEVLHLKSKLNACYTKDLVAKSFGTLNSLVVFCTTIENDLADLEARHPRQKQTYSTIASAGNKSGSTTTSNNNDRPNDSWKKKDPVPEKYRTITWPAPLAEYGKLLAEKRCAKCHEKGHSTKDREICPLGSWSLGALNAAKAGKWAFNRTNSSSAAVTEEAGKERATF
jgi:hypothetical protein